MISLPSRLIMVAATTFTAATTTVVSWVNGVLGRCPDAMADCNDEEYLQHQIDELRAAKSELEAALYDGPMP